MNRVRSYKKTFLTAFIVLTVVLSTPCFAKFKPLTIPEQFKNADHVIRAEVEDAHPVAAAGVGYKGTDLEYTIWTFLVKKEFKGTPILDAQTEEEVSRKIVVVGQTGHDWACPTPLKFERGTDYFLFLKKTSSSYLYTLVTDIQGASELKANPELEKIISMLSRK